MIVYVNLNLFSFKKVQWLKLFESCIWIRYQIPDARYQIKIRWYLASGDLFYADILYSTPFMASSSLINSLVGITLNFLENIFSDT